MHVIVAVALFTLLSLLCFALLYRYTIDIQSYGPDFLSTITIKGVRQSARTHACTRTHVLCIAESFSELIKMDRKMIKSLTNLIHDVTIRPSHVRPLYYLLRQIMLLEATHDPKRFSLTAFTPRQTTAGWPGPNLPTLHQ